MNFETKKMNNNDKPKKDLKDLSVEQLDQIAESQNESKKLLDEEIANLMMIKDLLKKKINEVKENKPK